MMRLGDEPNRLDRWVERHGLKIVGVLLALTTAWYTLKAQVSDIAITKVDNFTFTRYVIHQDSLMTEMSVILKAIQREQTNQHSYLCRGKQEQLGCQP